MPSQRRFVALLALLSLAGSGACRSMDEATERDAVISLARHGKYQEADRLAQELFERSPNDPVARRDALDARVAVILAAGIELVLQGEATDGLELITQARNLDSDNEVVRDWRNKTLVQIAEDALETSAGLTGRDSLQEKRAVLQRVLDILPPSDQSDRVSAIRDLARSGLARVEETIEYCEERSDRAYREGIHNFAGDRLRPAMRDFSMSCDYDHTNESAEDQHGHVEEMLSERRLDQARLFEEQGLHDAARKEYILVRKVDPDNEIARAGLNRTELETRASRLMVRAGLAAGRGELEVANALLAEAAALTVTQTDALERLRIEMRETRWKGMYEDAIAMQASGRLPEAAAGYSTLLGEAEFYEDAQSRLKVVEEFIVSAEELYEQFHSATDAAAASGFLRRISVFWPTYRDVAERLLALEEEDEGAED